MYAYKIIANTSKSYAKVASLKMKFILESTRILLKALIIIQLILQMTWKTTLLLISKSFKKYIVKHQTYRNGKMMMKCISEMLKSISQLKNL